ncbi:MAG TPA: glycosyl hydrolase-related protein [Chryseolinea sp.]
MKIYILFFLMSLSVALCAQTQKQLYISNDDHTDYMWTANEEQYKEAFLEMLDYYIAQSDQTASLPSAFQSRFNCDGTYWLWEYEKHKTPAAFQKLIDKIKSGHISVPYNAMVSCYGAIPAEGILRGMYYAGHLERKYGIKLDQAVAMENQTLPLGLGSLWAGSGVKYSWKGVCNCATKVKDLKKRDKEIYWYKGLDDSSVLMKWYSITGDNMQLGGYAEARNPSHAVDQLTALCTSPQYPYHIAGAFGYGWDDLRTTTDIFPATAREKTTPERQIIVSNHSDFFKAFEAAYGKVIPQESVAYGNEWDLYSASMAEVSAKVKRSVEKLRAAEAMSAIAGLGDKDFGAGLADMRQEAWMALGIYYEHDWTADGPVKRDDRAAWQRKVENRLTSYVDSLHIKATQKLGNQIKKNGNQTRFYAFNPLSWKRTDICDIPYRGSGAAKVFEVSSNKEVPSQKITSNGKQFIRILATDIPSVGYKVYKLIEGNPKSFPIAASFENNELENDFFKIKTTNLGVITSLVDKRNGNREWVANVNGKFMNDLGSGTNQSGVVRLEQNGPVSATIICQSKEPLSHTTRITLYHDIPRIDIHNEITENFSNVQSWSFSYNLDGAEVWHEETGAILKARLTTQGGHYASMNARFDWLTLHHFADIHDGKNGITLSNADCSFMKLGNSAFGDLDTQTRQLSVLAGGQVDGENLGILKQDGDSLFIQRFALGMHRDFNAAESMRFSLEHQNPFVCGFVTGTEPTLPEKEYSFLSITNPDIILWGIKPAEDGYDKGMIARVWNFMDNSSEFKLSFEKDIHSAFQATHVETDLRPAGVVNGDLQESIGKNQIKTFRVVLKSN